MRVALGRMPRQSELLAFLTSDPTSTSELYERVGYTTLTRLGLIPYPEFRQALAKLAAAGLAEHDTADDGSTVWWAAHELAQRRGARGFPCTGGAPSSAGRG